VADGVYELLMDGMELEELKDQKTIFLTGPVFG